MVLRKPLVTISGINSELPPGDSVEGAILTTTLTAGSGLLGGGSLQTNQRIDVGIASNPSGLILVGNNLGIDGVAQRTADAALASGNAALSSAVVAQASGNAALSRAGGTMTGPIIFAAGQQINTAVNLSGGISGAIHYQSAPNQTAFLSPGVSGQVLATQGSNQIPAWITPGGGKILQAVQATSTSSQTLTSTAYNAISSLSLSITPSSSSSRILLTTSFAMYTGNPNNSYYFTFTRNSGILSGANGFNIQSGQYGGYPIALTYIDSPSTTSAITYGIAAKTAATNTFYFNYDGQWTGQPATAVLTALEIAP